MSIFKVSLHIFLIQKVLGKIFSYIISYPQVIHRLWIKWQSYPQVLRWGVDSRNFSINNNFIKHKYLRYYNICDFWGEVDQSGTLWDIYNAMLVPDRYRGYPSFLLSFFIIYRVMRQETVPDTTAGIIIHKTKQAGYAPCLRSP